MVAAAAAPTCARLDDVFSIMPTNPKKRICPANKGESVRKIDYCPHSSLQDTHLSTRSCLLHPVIVLGSSNVGKTTLVHRLTASTPSEVSLPSTAPEVLLMGDYLERMAVVNSQQQLLKLHFWDTAGQSKFAPLSNAYFRHARGAILVYDVTSRRSFRDVLSTWLPQLEGFYSHSNAPFAVALIATKCDIESDCREVSKADGEWLAKIVNADHFIELSASSADADQCFNAIAESVAASKTWGISLDAVTVALAQLRNAARKTAVIAAVPAPQMTATDLLVLPVPKPLMLTISTASSEPSLVHSFQSSKLRSPSVQWVSGDFGTPTVSLLLRVGSRKHLALVCTSALLLLLPVVLLCVVVIDYPGALHTLGVVERVGVACASLLVIRV